MLHRHSQGAKLSLPHADFAVAEVIFIVHIVL